MCVKQTQWIGRQLTKVGEIGHVRIGPDFIVVLLWEDIVDLWTSLVNAYRQLDFALIQDNTDSLAYGISSGHIVQLNNVGPQRTAQSGGDGLVVGVP